MKLDRDKGALVEQAVHHHRIITFSFKIGVDLDTFEGGGCRMPEDNIINNLMEPGYKVAGVNLQADPVAGVRARISLFMSWVSFPDQPARSTCSRSGNAPALAK